MISSVCFIVRIMGLSFSRMHYRFKESVFDADSGLGPQSFLIENGEGHFEGTPAGPHWDRFCSLCQQVRARPLLNGQPIKLSRHSPTSPPA